MNKPNPKSRREFLRKTASASSTLGAASLGEGCKTADANPQTKTTTTGSPKDHTSKKLGEVRNNDLADFKMRRRMPHWAPDEIDPKDTDSTSHDPIETLYPEEAIL